MRAIIYDNLIIQTIEAEITAMMPLQRTRVAESRVRNKLSNGPPRAQSNVIFTKYSATLWAGVQMPGICWYPAKCTGHAVNQGGTADKCFIRP